MADHTIAAESPQERRKVLEVEATGAAAEAVTGAAAAVLAILGLTSVMPELMLTLATLAVAAAFLVQGMAIASEYSRLIEAAGAGRLGRAELGGGMSIEFISGGAGAVLGILALLGTLPVVLTAVAAICFGAAMILSSGITQRLSLMNVEEGGTEGARNRALRATVSSAIGAQLLVGLGGVALGILTLLQIVGPTLILIAMLAFGGTILLSGSALCTRFVALFRHA